ncbi:hypothetical protein LWI29_004948 [Acer saccharum]|uniref:Uncharacterized protein n=1 Tax=Acer saccharum TaxID=4024 RepID=A0AA39TAT2_ACESA|nr:hypothetical protein LWI29_004948 [Acer saccharum]
MAEVDIDMEMVDTDMAEAEADVDAELVDAHVDLEVDTVDAEADVDMFFTTEPYAYEPSSLPKYPPSKEMDVKFRDEEARRFTFLSFFMFTMSWINIGR